ncbi:hypothetical protein LSAT2_019570 [Lamellibrachia satsuma]|nr:hypothetical protein LSAT2_019570 [Lamellibrachia satsuma]
MGYVNAKIGIDNTGHEEVSGTLGLGKMNENGEIFADLCAFNKLIIGDEERDNPPDIPPTDEVLQINCKRPGKAENKKAIYLLKRFKASGPYAIPAEFIQADTEMLHMLTGKIWDKNNYQPGEKKKVTHYHNRYATDNTWTRTTRTIHNRNVGRGSGAVRTEVEMALEFTGLSGVKCKALWAAPRTGYRAILIQIFAF